VIRKLAWTKKRLAMSIVCAVLVGMAGLITLSQMNPRAQAAILTPYNFYNDFSGDLSQWTVVSGTWAIESGELSGSSLYATYIVAGDTSWTDYTLEARVNIKEDLGGPAPYDDSKVAFRRTNADNCYFLVLSYGIQRIRIFKVVGGVEASISEKPYAVYLNTNYNIKIEVVGSSIKAYVNNVLELDCVDTSLANGKIGLGVDREHTHFDDVRVSDAKDANVSGTYSVNVRAGVTRIIVTCTWNGSGDISIKLSSPVITYYESDMSIYEKTKASIDGTTTCIFNIKRAELSIDATSLMQTWTLYLSLSDDVTTYQVSVETY